MVFSLDSMYNLVAEHISVQARATTGVVLIDCFTQAEAQK